MVKQYNSKFRVGQGGLKEVSSDVTLDEGVDQLVLVDASAGPVTVTLQRADGSGGKRLCIKKIDSDPETPVTIIPSVSQTIDGKPSFILTQQNEFLEIISDNENWIALNKIGGWILISKTEITQDGEFGNIINPIFNAIDFDDDSMVVIVIDIGVTAATNLFIRPNGINSANYFRNGRSIINGVETIINDDGVTFMVIASSNILTGADKPAHIIAYLQLNKAGGSDDFGIQSFANGTNTDGNENTSGSLTVSQSSLTDMEIGITAGNWQAGTRISIYKVSKR